ncbi:hypothetical protein [Lysobacter sp. HA35]
MSLPWSAQQIEWLQAMGLEVLQRPMDAPASIRSATSSTDVPAGLMRAARGVDVASLVATHGMPRDVATRRALWRALRPLRKAARSA